MNNKIILNALCVDYTYNGLGIIKNKDKVIFVPGLLKGEIADIKVIKFGNNHSLGKIIKLIKKSEHRINPKCNVSTSCGGCCFQNLDYNQQIQIKQKYVNDTLHHIGTIDNKVNHFYKMENPYNFRNKVQVPFSYDKQNRLIYGFYKEYTHDIIYCQNCNIQDLESINILKTLQKLFIFYNIKPYIEKDNTGVIKNVLIKNSLFYKEYMVVLITKETDFKNKNNLVSELIKKHPNIKTIIQNINKDKTNVILGKKEILLYGEGYIREKLCGFDFKISSKSFFQTNIKQTEVLYNLAIQMADLNKNNNVLDCYCGTGTIGLIASKYVNNVLGIEIIKEAINDANYNKELNKIDNIEFKCLDIKDLKINNTFDCVFVDPPRKGLDKNLIDILLTHEFEKIIYISCNPSTLARDLSILKEKYIIKEINCVDMFPHTMHVETIALLYQK